MFDTFFFLRKLCFSSEQNELKLSTDIISLCFNKVRQVACRVFCCFFVDFYSGFDDLYYSPEQILDLHKISVH